jgi:hypothetical protein
MGKRVFTRKPVSARARGFAQVLLRAFVPLIIGGTIGLSGIGAAADSPSQHELDAITERGRALVAYDQAAWHSTDAVLALKPRDGAVSHYIPRRTPTGWVVAFGHLADAGDAFIIEYEATANSESGPFVAAAVKPARRDTDYFLHAVRAIELAKGDFQFLNRQYNVAALPIDTGEWWVYLIPAQVKADVWPLGGDGRYRISADGSRIVEKRQLHKSIIEQPVPKNAAAGFHTHILSDLPEDTDVFLVLVRRPAVSEFVGTRDFIYEIHTDGTISSKK